MNYWLWIINKFLFSIFFYNRLFKHSLWKSNSHCSNIHLMRNAILQHQIWPKNHQIRKAILVLKRSIKNPPWLTEFQNHGIPFSSKLIISIYFTFIIDRRMFYSCLKSKMNIFALILFICLSMTVGILIVCFTSPKPSMCLICYL